MLALVGGVILNIMPCVLPVLSLKVMGFVQHANEERSKVVKLGLVFALGVLASFLALALVVISGVVVLRLRPRRAPACG